MKLKENIIQLNDKLDKIIIAIAQLNEQINNISMIQSIQNDSLAYLVNRSNNDSNILIKNKVNTLDAKINDMDLKVSTIEDTLDIIKEQVDNIPDQFQNINDILNSVYSDKKGTNPYGGIILSS